MQTPKAPLKWLDRFSSFVESPRAFPYWIGAVVLISLFIIFKPQASFDTYFPMTVPVHVVSDPPGASIFIQGIEVGKTTPAELDLSLEQLDLVEVRLGGYEPNTYRKFVEDDVIQIEYILKLPGTPVGNAASTPSGKAAIPPSGNAAVPPSGNAAVPPSGEAAVPPSGEAAVPPSGEAATAE